MKVNKIQFSWCMYVFWFKLDTGHYKKSLRIDKWHSKTAHKFKPLASLVFNFLLHAKVSCTAVQVNLIVLGR